MVGTVLVSHHRDRRNLAVRYHSPSVIFLFKKRIHTFQSAFANA